VPREEGVCSLAMQHSALKRTLWVISDDSSLSYPVIHSLGGDYRIELVTPSDTVPDLVESLRPAALLMCFRKGDDQYNRLTQRIKRNLATVSIPILFLVKSGNTETEIASFEAGAADYIRSPCEPAILKFRIERQLSMAIQPFATQAPKPQVVVEGGDDELALLERLNKAVAYRDRQTAAHAVRMGKLANTLALAAGESRDWSECLMRAAPLHDVGKIGIPDHILMSPGPLSSSEWQVMRKHPRIGASIIGKHRSDLMQAARSVALTHHEWWNGEGYPAGIKGKEIPLEGRIVAIADVFDALTTQRPYKQAWPVEKAVTYLRERAGTQFDPLLVSTFIEALEDDEALGIVASLDQTLD